MLGGITDGDKAHRLYGIRQQKIAVEEIGALFNGVSTAPYSAEPHGMSGQKDILGHGGTILHPKSGALAVESAVQIAAYHIAS